MNETIPNLEYHGTAMIAEPINISMTILAVSLDSGLPMVAKLEPGDGTHYCLLIVPAWSIGVRDHLGRYGIRALTAHEYLLITQLGDTGGTMFYAFQPGAETWDMQGIKNEWTREVFSWWTQLLWEKIQQVRNK